MIDLPAATGCRDAFARDGFVILRTCAASADVDVLAGAALRLARSGAVRIDHRSGQDGLAYRVVSGERVQQEAPELFELYRSPALLQWVRAVTDCSDAALSAHLRSAININCLTQPGEQYPLHKDAVPYTALLFLSDVEEDAGGAFVIESLHGTQVRVQPARGCLMLMDGCRCAHGVAPLRHAAIRLTVPMVFPALHVERPQGLDEYLYGR